LLARLDEFPDAILVAGCQRSGTTAICRIVKEALDMPTDRITKDDELDAALILSGVEQPKYRGRSCFQTTYLNERVTEYAEHSDFKLIWVLRQPHAVIRSMLHNWRRAALRRLFHGCGSQALEGAAKDRYERFGTLFISRLTMACHSYNVKTAQIHYLSTILSPDRLAIVDYDLLLQDKEQQLLRLLGFAGLPLRAELLDRFKRPTKRRSAPLSKASAEQVTQLCQQEYDRASALAERWQQQ
jgi:hypothetical protein